MDIKPVAGIDVGKYFSEMVILSPANEILSRLKINHDSSDDIEKAVSLLKKAEKDYGKQPAVVMEATGHYHKILFHALIKSGYEVSITNPIQAHSIRNIGIRKVKNDKKDAYTIAMLYRLQELKTTNIPSEDIECLRSLCRQYHDVSCNLAAFKNRLRSIIDLVMLNFGEVFPDIFCDTALKILEKYPTPDDILKANKKKLVDLIFKTSCRSLKWSESKYQLLIKKAKEFEPLSLNNKANISALKAYVSMVENLQVVLNGIYKEIEYLIEEDSKKDQPWLYLSIQLLCTIPGIGMLSAAIIVGEIGNFSAFSNQAKLVAYAGIDPSVKQSGQFIGTRNRISKRGSTLLRKTLFNVAAASVRKKRDGNYTNPVLADYYSSKCMSKPKKVALCAVMHKLIMIVYAVLRDKKPFALRTPEEHRALLASKAIA